MTNHDRRIAKLEKAIGKFEVDVDRLTAETRKVEGQVQQTTQVPWDEIDPEIRDLVRVLIEHGFPTHHSCSGHRAAGGQSQSHNPRAPRMDCAEVGFDVTGLPGLHRLAAALNLVDRALDGELLFDLSINWSDEVHCSLDPSAPERLPVLREIQELSDSGEESYLAPHAEQLQRVAVAFKSALRKTTR